MFGAVVVFELFNWCWEFFRACRGVLSRTSPIPSNTTKIQALGSGDEVVLEVRGIWSWLILVFSMWPSVWIFTNGELRQAAAAAVATAHVLGKG